MPFNSPDGRRGRVLALGRTLCCHEAGEKHPLVRGHVLAGPKVIES